MAQRQSRAVGGEELLQKSLALKGGREGEREGEERALETGGGWASRRSDGGVGRMWPREYPILNFKVFSVLRHSAAQPFTYMCPCARVNVGKSRKKICILHLS